MRRVVARELMDDPGVDPLELAANFVDIERANRYFGGLTPIVRSVLATRARSFLDVACGSGDVVRAVANAARRRGRALDIAALDYSESVLAIARARTPARDARFVEGDATALPFDAASFDATSCNLALHHFEPDAAVVVLRELRRVARIAPFVCDLERSRVAHLGARAFARVIARNAMTKHDGPLSVLRAYTAAELVALARRAGWRAPVARRLPFFRVLLTDRA